MDWNLKEIEDFLNIKAKANVFTLPYLKGQVCVAINPEENRVGILTLLDTDDEEEREPLRASICCTKIEVNDEHRDQGGDCIVLSGNGGHVCISNEGEYFSFFFSMYGN